jgi:hypothetical protein
VCFCCSADDVFVFLDAWKQSRAQPLVVSGSAAGRFAWTLDRSFRAMLVTTATTCVAFTCLPPPFPSVLIGHAASFTPY